MAFVLKISLHEDLRRISVPDYSSFTFTILSETLHALFGEELPKNYSVQYVDDEGDEIVVSSDDELREGFRVAVEDNRKSLRIQITSCETVSPLNLTVPPLLCRPSSNELDTPPLSPRANSLTFSSENTKEATKDVTSDVVGDSAEGRLHSSEKTIFASVKTEKTTSHISAAVHTHVACDGCGMSPIRGVRYKSSVEEDFDLCEVCDDEGRYEATHAPFLKIRTPDKAPKTIVTILGADNPDWRRNYRGGNGCRGIGNGYGHGQRRGISASHRSWQSRGQRQQQIFVPTAFQQSAEKFSSRSKTSITNSLMAQSVRAVKKEKNEVKKEKNAVRPMARFVKDVTVPDGTKFKPNEQFVKTWLIRNDGKNAWPARSCLMPVGGDVMVSGNVASEGVAPNGEVLPGQEVKISVQLTAPSNPGRYVEHFRMQSDDQRFGHRVWADIVVEEIDPETKAPQNPEMNITPDIALAVSAKLRALQVPEPESESQQSADPQESASFVMVPLPEPLLVPNVKSESVVAPPLDSAPPAYFPPSVETTAAASEETIVPLSSPEPLATRPAPEAPTPATPAIHAPTLSPVNNIEFQDELNQLAEMGFRNVELLLDILAAEKGDMQRVVERLLL